jgi:hypothetical protein
LLIPPPQITTYYDYLYCSIYAIVSGEDWTYVFCSTEAVASARVAPFRPPFSYNFVCFSTILTAYIPVYLLTYCFKIIVPALVSYVLATFVRYEQLSPLLRSRVRGILWPSYWPSTRSEMVSSSLHSGVSPVADISSLEEHLVHESTFVRPMSAQSNQIIDGAMEQSDLSTSELLYKPAKVFGSIAQDFCILFTFGLCSPVLALAVGLYSLISILHTRIMISRFVHLRQSSSLPGEGEDEALSILERLLSGMVQDFHQMIWPIVWSSCFFIAFLCWEISGDSIGWEKSLWVPITTVLVAVAIHLTSSWWPSKRLLWLGESYLRLIDRMFSDGRSGSLGTRPSHLSVSSTIELNTSLSRQTVPGSSSS